jgi:hypothetical protein
MYWEVFEGGKGKRLGLLFALVVVVFGGVVVVVVVVVWVGGYERGGICIKELNKSRYQHPRIDWFWVDNVIITFTTQYCTDLSVLLVTVVTLSIGIYHWVTVPAVTNTQLHHRQYVKSTPLLPI